MIVIRPFRTTGTVKRNMSLGQRRRSRLSRWRVDVNGKTGKGSCDQDLILKELLGCVFAPLPPALSVTNISYLLVISWLSLNCGRSTDHRPFQLGLSLISLPLLGVSLIGKRLRVLLSMSNVTVLFHYSSFITDYLS